LQQHQLNIAITSVEHSNDIRRLNIAMTSVHHCNDISSSLQ